MSTQSPPKKKSEPVLYSDVKRRRRRTCSICKCIFIASAALFLFFACFVARELVRSSAQTTGRPYPQLFANKTLEEVGDLQGVVRPLVDETTKFDIIATVRVRQWMERRKPALPTGVSGERVIFSGAIFKGLTLQDENVHTKVNLSIPLGAFTEESLDNYDLRATFTLVPQSPSLLDYMSGSSTWYPSMDVNKLIVQPESAQCHADRSLTKKQLATTFFSITIPLIEFNPIKSACGEDSDGPSWEPEDVETLHSQRVVSSQGRPALQAHPYVITRTDLRVVRMTELYDVLSWMMFHKALGLNFATNPIACPPRLFTKPTIEDLWNCNRTFPGLGNTEVAIKVTTPDKSTGENVTSLAYAPYMEAPYRSWGPLDLIPIPVKRERCPVDADLGVIKPYYKPLSVVWKVAFSASSPLRLQVAHLLAGERRYNVTDTDYNKAIQQMKSERICAAGGHLFTLGNKMWTRWAFDEINGILFPLARIFYIAYWMLLASTEGISVLGSALLSVSYLIPYLSELLPFRNELEKPNAILAMDIKARAMISLGIWKSLSRVQVSKSLPFLRRRKANTHERETQRAERTIWGIRAMFLMFAALSVSLFDALDAAIITILPRVGPAPDDLISSSIVSRIWAVAQPTLSDALFVTGEILQLFLNYRLKQFAGRQKIVAFVVLVSITLRYLMYLPLVAGHPPLRHPLTIAGVVHVGIALAWAIQALLYPSVGHPIDHGSENKL